MTKKLKVYIYENFDTLLCLVHIPTNTIIIIIIYSIQIQNAIQVYHNIKLPIYKEPH